MFKGLLRKFGSNALSVLKRFKGDAVDSEVLQKLDEGYAKLLQSESKSLLKKHLSPELFEKLKTKRTKTSTLLDCIQSGLIHHDSDCGVYAACPGCYKVFAELFDPIIEDYHLGFKGTDKHSPVDFGDPSVFEDIDPNNNFIASTRIRCARSLQGYPFNPVMTVDHYNEIEDKLHCISSDFEGEHRGQFRSLCRLDKAARARLLDDHCLITPDDRFLVAANAYQYWPTGRGIFHNFDRTFLVWCNGDDHLSITSMQRGGNFAEVYARLIGGLCAIEESLPFVRDDRLGFLTFCPTNLGAAIRGSVHIKIPKLAANKAVLEDVAIRHQLRVLRADGERGKTDGGFCEISNSRRLGLSEFDAVSDLYCGIREIIQLEKGEKELPVVKRRPQGPPPHIDPQKAIKSGLIDERKKKWAPAAVKSVNKPSDKIATKKLTEKQEKKHEAPFAKTTEAKPVKEELQKPAEKMVKKSAKKAKRSAVTPAATNQELRKKELKKPEAVEQALKKQVAKKPTPKKEASTKKATARASSKSATVQFSKEEAPKTSAAVMSKNPSCFDKNKSKPYSEKSQKSSKETVTKSDVSKKDRKKASQSTDPCTRAGIKKPKIQGSNPCKHKVHRKKQIPEICKNIKKNSEKSGSSQTQKSTKTDCTKSEKGKSKKSDPSNSAQSKEIKMQADSCKKGKPVPKNDRKCRK